MLAMRQMGKKLFREKYFHYYALFIASALLSGCAKEPAIDPSLPDNVNWIPVLQTTQVPASTFYVNTKTLQKGEHNIYKGSALMQPVWFTQVNPDAENSQMEMRDFSLTWQFTLNCNTKKLQTHDYTIVKGLFSQGEVIPIEVEHPYTEGSILGKKILSFYCKK